jgi:hypothetical protein
MSNSFTHKELVDLGAKWLSGNQNCKAVVKELKVMYQKETPDVLGWKKKGQSIMIECKTSMQDFKNDAKKPSRLDFTKSFGIQKYYLCPQGLIQIKSLPNDWGLLYANKKGIKIVKKAVTKTSLSEKIAKNELPLLIALVQRAQIRGFDVNCRLKDK